MSETPVRAVHGPGDDQPGGDPWAAFGYLVAGVVFYGAIGWVLSLWLHASYWIPIGILFGAGFGMYMVFARYRIHSPAPRLESSTTDEVRIDRPAGDDRGETPA